MQNSESEDILGAQYFSVPSKSRVSESLEAQYCTLRIRSNNAATYVRSGCRGLDLVTHGDHGVPRIYDMQQ